MACFGLGVHLLVVPAESLDTEQIRNASPETEILCEHHVLGTSEGPAPKKWIGFGTVLHAKSLSNWLWVKNRYPKTLKTKTCGLILTRTQLALTRARLVTDHGVLPAGRWTIRRSLPRCGANRAANSPLNISRWLQLPTSYEFHNGDSDCFGPSPSFATYAKVIKQCDFLLAFQTRFYQQAFRLTHCRMLPAALFAQLERASASSCKHS